MSAAAHIDAGLKPFTDQVKASIQDFGDMIVGAFDKIMTKAVNEGGIFDAAKSLGSGLSNLGSSMSMSSSNIFGMSPSASPEHAQSLSPELSTPEVTPTRFPPEVAAAAMAAFTPAIPPQEVPHIGTSPTGNTGVSPTAIGVAASHGPGIGC